MGYVTGFEPLNAAETELVEACVAGTPCALGDGSRPEGPDPDRSIRAELLRFLILGGDEGCAVAHTGVQLVGAYVSGGLDLSFATAKGATLLGNCRFASEVFALQTRFEALTLAGAALPGLFAQGAKVAGGVFLRMSPDGIPFHATGEVSLSGAEIGGQLSCIGGRFENAEGNALKAQGARVSGDVTLSEGFHATGEVSLAGAKIGGQLSCMGGRFENPKGNALNAQGTRVSGDMFLSEDFYATGAVHLSGAEISGQLACVDCSFEDAEGDALNAQRLNVKEGLFWGGVTVASGAVDFTAAHVGDLEDDLASWPKGGRVILDGFSYDRIGRAFTDAPQRLEWLARGTVWNGEFFPQPYVQLARVLREMGHEAGARDVLTEQGRLIRFHARRRARVVPNGDIGVALRSTWVDILHPILWLWDRVQLWGVGYGYNPKRALFWLFGLFLIAAYAADATWREGSFAPNSDVILVSPGWVALADDPGQPNPAVAWSRKGAPGKDWESFSSLGYAADVVIPVLALGQTAAWAPSTTRGPWGRWLWWGRWVLTMAGWFVSALGLAAITGIIRRD